MPIWPRTTHGRKGNQMFLSQKILLNLFRVSSEIALYKDTMQRFLFVVAIALVIPSKPFLHI